MTTVKHLWLEVDGSTAQSGMDFAFNCGFSGVLLREIGGFEVDFTRFPGSATIGCLIASKADIVAVKAKGILEKSNFLVYDSLGFDAPVPELNGNACGIYHRITDLASLQRAVVLAGKCDFLILEVLDPTNIPLELVLAKIGESAREVRIFKRSFTAVEGMLALQTMERGSHGILLASDEVKEIAAVSKRLAESQLARMDLEEGTIVRLAHTGMGTRVCIDTTEELMMDEGILLGSTSSGGILTCSETHELPYMNLRPFRVNAGALHLYAWGPDNMVRYLSELKAGDTLYAVSIRGEARIVTVGRVKMERRPLLLVECQVRGVSINTFIQDDWHVRLFGSGGKVTPSTELRVGRTLLCRMDEPGRHVGIKIDAIRGAIGGYHLMEKSVQAMLVPFWEGIAETAVDHPKGVAAPMIACEA